MEQVALGGNVMIAVRDVKRPISGKAIGQKIVALAYNFDATDFDGNRTPSFQKRYILREQYCDKVTEEKLQRFAKRYYSNARIFHI